MSLLHCDQESQDTPVSGQDPSTQQATSGPSGPASFVAEDFSPLYQVFLKRYLPATVKSDRWVRNYKGRWVRWTGQLVAFSTTGLKFRQLQPTLTFDVSIIVNQPQRAQLTKILKPGKFYTYIARLDSYDDLFHTVYLDQGVVLNPTPEGLSAVLPPLPPPLKPTSHAPKPE